MRVGELQRCGSPLLCAEVRLSVAAVPNFGGGWNADVPCVTHAECGLHHLGRPQLRVTILIAAFALGACHGPGADAGDRTDTNAGVVKSPGASAATVTPILRTGRTISGQPLKLPQGEAEMAAVSVDIPAGQSLPIHQHPWSRLFYVERGTLRVTNHDTGMSMDFKAGQAGAEAVGQWHAGSAVGEGPVRLIVIDLVPPGVNNTIMKAASAAR
jgi:quercetin dioxygenase-like cupin family protein